MMHIDLSFSACLLTSVSASGAHVFSGGLNSRHLARGAIDV